MGVQGRWRQGRGVQPETEGGSTAGTGAPGQMPCGTRESAAPEPSQKKSRRSESRPTLPVTAQAGSPQPRTAPGSRLRAHGLPTLHLTPRLLLEPHLGQTPPHHPAQTAERVPGSDPQTHRNFFFTRVSDDQELRVSAAQTTHATHSLTSPPWPYSPICWEFNSHCVTCPHPQRDPLTKARRPGPGVVPPGPCCFPALPGRPKPVVAHRPLRGESRREAAFLPPLPP